MGVWKGYLIAAPDECLGISRLVYLLELTYLVVARKMAFPVGFDLRVWTLGDG